MVNNADYRLDFFELYSLRNRSFFYSPSKISRALFDGQLIEHNEIKVVFPIPNK